MTDADSAFPSGDAFMVYPGPNGTPWSSIRQLVFAEALNDLRAFRLLESLTSRDYVMNLSLIHILVEEPRFWKPQPFRRSSDKACDFLNL